MTNADSTSIPLDYSHRRPRPQSRLRRWIGKLPPLLIGLFMLMPVWLFFHLGFGSMEALWRYDRQLNYVMPALCFAAVALPGAVRRANGRHVLAILGLAVLYGVAVIKLPDGPAALPFYYLTAFWAALPILLVATAEWLLHSPRKTSTLAWLVLLAIGGGCLFVLFTSPVTFATGLLHIRTVHGGYRLPTFDHLAQWPLLMFLIWWIIPAADRLGQQPTRRRRIVALGLASASIAGFGVFFGSLMYPLAQRSLPQGHPFVPSQAVAILQTRLDPADLEPLWRTVEQADWSTWEDNDPSDLSDYRTHCTAILIKHDRPAAAVRLAALLRRQPAQLLMQECAELLATERRYEAVPTLTRFAFTEFSMIGDTEASSALKTLRVWDWVNDPDRTIEGRPASLGWNDAVETDRVADAMVRYFEAAGRLYEAGYETGYEVPAPKLNVSGTAALEAEVQRYVDRVDSQIARRPEQGEKQ